MVKKVLRGRNCLSRLPELMEALSVRRPLIVGSQRLTARLPVDGARFSGYHPNPDFADAAAGAALYRQNACDGLISIGGGSAMDSAKAVKAMLLSANDDAALRSELTGDEAIPHIAVPATAGTGAEATQFAVVYVAGRKVSLSHPALLPDGVVLDASLLDTLPVYHKKSCALDALCQGIESYWAKGATEDSQVNAFLAVTGVLDNLRGYLAGDSAAAEGMLEAAYRSGRAIQVSRTTAAHAMSYQITKRLGLAHGHACALTLPVLWEQMLNQEDALPVLMDLAQKMRLGSEYMPPKLLWGLLIDLGMEPERVPDEETLAQLTDSVDPERLSNHPVPLTREDLKRAYRLAFTRKAGPERQVCVDLWRYYGQS